MDTIGTRIKLVREAVGISQSQMGKLLGCGKSFISAIENDKSKLTIEQLVNLIVNYNVNSNYILVGQGEMFNPPKFEDVQNEFVQKVELVLKKNNLI